MEVLVEDERSPQHPNLFPELSVQGQINGKGKGKRKRDNMDDYQRQILELEARKIEFLENKSKQKTGEPEDETCVVLQVSADS